MLNIILFYLAISTLFSLVWCGDVIGTSTQLVCIQSAEEPECSNKTFVLFEGSFDETVGFQTVAVADNGSIVDYEVTFGIPFVFWSMFYVITVPLKWDETPTKHFSSEPFGVPNCNPNDCGTFVDPLTGRTLANGFCCFKPLADFFLSFETTQDDLRKFEINRGDLFFGTRSTKYTTRHCFAEDINKLDLFRFGPTKIFFEARVIIRVNGTVVFNETVDPYTNLRFTTDVVTIELEGKFRGPQEYPDLANSFLAVPSAGGITATPELYTILLQKEEVSLDGTVCNRIGVSRETLSQQGTKCRNAVVNDCIRGQILDKVNFDVTHPDTPRYRISLGIPTLLGIPATVDIGNLIMRVPLGTTETTQMKIIADESGVRTLVNNASALIVGMFADIPLVSAQNFAEIQVDVQNIDSVGAYFFVDMECEFGVQEQIPAKARTINAGEIESFVFLIRATQNIDTNQSCTATVTSRIGEFKDDHSITFTQKQFISIFAPLAYVTEITIGNGSVVGEAAPPFGFGISDFTDTLIDIINLVASQILPCGCGENITVALTCLEECAFRYIVYVILAIINVLLFINLVIMMVMCLTCRRCSIVTHPLNLCVNGVARAGRRLFQRGLKRGARLLKLTTRDARKAYAKLEDEEELEESDTEDEE